MKKVYFAIGCRPFEEALRKKMKDNYEFVGETVYKEGIIKGVESKNPDIIVIRETLSGQAPIMDIIYELRCNHTHVRIVFISKNDRSPGDVLLSSLVSYGVYDIFLGENTNIDDIVNALNKAKKISDVMYLQPKIKVDEKSNNVLFEAPEQQTKKVEVIKYIDNTEIVDKKEYKKESIDLELGQLDTNLSFEKVEDKKSDSNDSGLTINEIEEISLEKVEEQTKPIVDTNKIKEEIMKKAEAERQKAVQQAEEKARREALAKMREQEKENLAKIKEKEKEALAKMKEQEKESLAKIKEQEKETRKVEKDKQQILEQLNKLKDSTFSESNKQKIISFVGAKHGCGNTQIAFNTALDLALSGKKVIYLEVSNNISTIGYTYQIYNIEHGIETALKGISNDKYDEIDKAIINLGSLINNVDKKHVLYNSYKKLPKTLDVMFVSESYIQKNNYLKTEDFSKEQIKELYLYLMYQKAYDVLIIDISGDVNSEMLYTSVVYSNKVFFTITQDVNTISQCIYRINLMNKKRINLKEKIYYIINKFDTKAKLGIKDIEEWLGERIECNIVSILEEYNRLFIDSNYIGMPIILNSPNRNIRQAFNQITKKINE